MSVSLFWERVGAERRLDNGTSTSVANLTKILGEPPWTIREDQSKMLMAMYHASGDSLYEELAELAANETAIRVTPRW